MIQSVLFSSFTPLKNKDEINCWENRPFAMVWPEKEQQMKRDINKPIKKKVKRVRTAFTSNQLLGLENMYSQHKYINSLERAQLAKTLNIGEKCIKIWFQNRRMKEKRESSESSNDSSSESVSIESASVAASSPLQEIFDEPILENMPHHPDEDSHCPESTYQLPTYYNTNEIQPVYEDMAPPDFASYFYNENSVYPTQYFPYNVNYSIGEGNGYNQYGSVINNCGTENQYPYYSNI